MTQSATDKLLPCPFCGGDAVLGTWDNGYYSGYKVTCCVKISADADATKHQVIEKWNTRAVPDYVKQMVEAIRKAAEYINDGRPALADLELAMAINNLPEELRG